MLAHVQAAVPPTVTLVQVATGLNQPVLVTHAGDGTGRVFIVEQPGLVRVLNGGVLDPTPYLDLRSLVRCCGEQGLLGLAFHPAFETNGRLFVFYTAKTAPNGGVGDETLAEYHVAAPATGRPDPASGVTLLRLSDPFTNHNGGNIQFGPDGYLYVGIGDGGSGGDPLHNAQNLGVLFGKMLRLDVSTPGAYAVPATNPFVSTPGARGEIWAYGLRNPWRWSFDRATGDLWIGDVGQNQMEEVDYQAAASAGGQNYGWNQWEGHLPYTIGTGLNPIGMTFPVQEYPHGDGSCAVTGGYVYRGPSIPVLDGAYVYGDYCTGVLYEARGVAGIVVGARITDTPYFVSSFGEDEAGNLYLVNLGGSVLRFA